MQFSAKLINRLRHFQMEHTKDSPVLQLDPIPNVDSDKLLLGKAMREMSKDMVVFLRCALDYKENRKTVDNNVNNKAFLLYNQVNITYKNYKICSLKSRKFCFL